MGCISTKPKKSIDGKGRDDNTTNINTNSTYTPMKHEVDQLKNQTGNRKI